MKDESVLLNYLNDIADLMFIFYNSSVLIYRALLKQKV